MEEDELSFEALDCWKAGRALRKFVAARIVRPLPAHERFRLGDQVLRAARSITANLAEGHGRFHYLDKCKFCSTARGSATEVLDHLITGADEGLISEELLKEGRDLVTTTTRLINGYARYLRRRAGEGRGGNQTRLTS